MYGDVQLSYLFISGYDLYRQMFTTKPSIVCVHDNVRKSVFAIFQGKWGDGAGRGGGGASGTYQPLESATVSTE